jgi:coenzyme F420-reducing hydrogenase beta subunit
VAERPTDLRPVLDNDLCIACGACVAADPTVQLELHPDKLLFEPTSVGGPDAAAVCPAIGVDYAGLQQLRFPGATPGIHGVVERVLLAQSSDEDRNLAASSGGVIKELLSALLARDEVAGVIALDHADGLRFAPRLLTDPAEIDRLPGSIYHNLPKDEVIPLLRRAPGPVVLVGIPCELEGILAYVHRLEPELADRIHTTVGLLCGWQYSWHAIRAISRYQRIDPERIETIAYRGGGPVGKLRLTTTDGEERAVSRRVNIGYQVAFDRTFNTPRCHLCVNHANLLADVVVGDAWLPSTLGTRSGISLVVTRTEATDRLLDELAATGRLVISETDVDALTASQKPAIAFGDHAYAYAALRDDLGLFRPDLEAPNRSAASPVPRREVLTFHRELQRKLALQRAGRYRLLYLRKVTRELPRFASRYWQWFLTRVLGRTDRTRTTTSHRAPTGFR